MHISNLKKNLVSMIGLILMGFLSYITIYFAYRQLPGGGGNFWINIMTLTLIYIYGKKIGSFLFLMGASTGFLLINNICYFLGQYFPIFYPTEAYGMDFKLFIFIDILLFFFYTLIYKKMIDNWHKKKIFRYFITSSFLVPTYYILFFIISSLFSVQHRPISVEHMLVEEQSLEVLLRLAGIGIKSMMFNLNLIICSSFSNLLIPLFTMQSPLDQRFTKIDTWNVTVSKWHKIIFLLLVGVTGFCHYLNYFFLTMVFMSYSISFMFLFFLIGREIFFKSIDQFTGQNMMWTLVIFRLIITIIPMILYFWIITGFIEAYLKIWNPDRDKYLE